MKTKSGPASLFWLSMAAAVGVCMSCSSIFWRKTAEFDSAHWLNDSTVVEIVVHYKEKDPFPPIGVTHTLKKDHRTELVVHTIEGTRVLRTDSTGRVSFPGRAFGGLAVIGPLWLTVRRSNPESAVTEELVLVDSRTKSVRGVNLGLGGSESVARLISSPDSKRVLIMLRSTDASRLVILDRIGELRAPAAPRSGATTGLTLSGPEPTVTWAVDSGAVFVLHEGRVFAWNGSDKRTAERFPQCFVPATIGGLLSPDGRRFFRPDAASEPQITRVPGFIPFGKIPAATSTQAIGRDCPE